MSESQDSKVSRRVWLGSAALTGLALAMREDAAGAEESPAGAPVTADQGGLVWFEGKVTRQPASGGAPPKVLVQLLGTPATLEFDAKDVVSTERTAQGATRVAAKLQSPCVIRIDAVVSPGLSSGFAPSLSEELPKKLSGGSRSRSPFGSQMSQKAHGHAVRSIEPEATQKAHGHAIASIGEEASQKSHGHAVTFYMNTDEASGQKSHGHAVVGLQKVDLGDWTLSQKSHGHVVK